MNKEFIPYEQALELKELGFNEECAAHFQNVGDLKPKWKQYDDATTKIMELRLLQAPLYQQAFRWFREKYDLKKYGTFPHHTIMFNYLSEGGKKEEAELVCLIKLIEIAKTQILKQNK